MGENRGTHVRRKEPDVGIQNSEYFENYLYLFWLLTSGFFYTRNFVSTPVYYKMMYREVGTKLKELSQ